MGDGGGEGPNGALTKRRGRPPGARSKRSLELGRYLAAMYGGMTPGQQAAALALVSPRDLRRCKAEARELRIMDHGLGRLELAMAVKAAKLAAALSCERKEAWLLMDKAREGLMPYVHQKRPQAPAETPGDRATVFVVPDGQAGQLALSFDDDGGEVIEILSDD